MGEQPSQRDPVRVEAARAVGGHPPPAQPSPDGLVEETLYEDYSSYEEPTWAPDGRHIAATVREGGKSWIVVIDIDTKEKRRLVQGEFPDWSPLPPEPRAELLGR